MTTRFETEMKAAVIPILEKIFDVNKQNCVVVLGKSNIEKYKLQYPQLALIPQRSLTQIIGDFLIANGFTAIAHAPTTYSNEKHSPPKLDQSKEDIKKSSMSPISQRQDIIPDIGELLVKIKNTNSLHYQKGHEENKVIIDILLEIGKTQTKTVELLTESLNIQTSTLALFQKMREQK